MMTFNIPSDARALISEAQAARKAEPFRGLFRVTWERITPESAEDGEADARGYAHPNGGNDETHKVDEVSAYHWTLASIVRRFGDKSCEDAGRRFDVLSADECLRTGAESRYSIHPPRGVSDASYARLRRILCFRSN